MLKIQISILVLLLPFASLAQQPAKVKVDNAPMFVENTYGFVDYVTFYHTKPLQIKKDLKTTINVTIHIDTNGIGSVLNIQPKVDREVYKEFVSIVNDAPQWTPALIKYQPVAYNEVFVFDVELNKAASAMNIKEHRDKPAVQDTSEGDHIFTAIDKLADFPGGQKAFNQFLRTNIQYPELAKQKRTQGLVLIEAIIDRDGSLTKMNIVHDPGNGLGTEALRVLSLSPKWSPYWTCGSKVRVQRVIPVRFTL